MMKRMKNMMRIHAGITDSCFGVGQKKNMTRKKRTKTKMMNRVFRV